MRRRSPIWVYISTNVENAASLTLAVGSESKLTIEARNFVTVKLWAPYLKTFAKLWFYKSHIVIRSITEFYPNKNVPYMLSVFCKSISISSRTFPFLCENAAMFFSNRTWGSSTSSSSNLVTRNPAFSRTVSRVSPNL